MAKCCMKKCNKNYCNECIIQHFNKVKILVFRNLLWICIRKIPGYAILVRRAVIARNAKIISWTQLKKSRKKEDQKATKCLNKTISYKIRIKA